MTRERGAHAESKNCEILLFPTADRRFETKVKCPTGRASFWVKFPTVQSLTRVKCPGFARGGGGMGGLGIDWRIIRNIWFEYGGLYRVSTVFGRSSNKHWRDVTIRLVHMPLLRRIGFLVNFIYLFIYFSVSRDGFTRIASLDQNQMKN